MTGGIFPGGRVVKSPPANAGDTGDMGSISVGKIPLEKEMATYSSIFDPMDRKSWRLPTPVFLPGKFHRQWSLTGDS